MTVTHELVAFNHIEMAGTCDHCGTAWQATGLKQGGMNDREAIICPSCGQPTGGTMHCAVGPFVELTSPRLRGYT